MVEAATQRQRHFVVSKAWKIYKTFADIDHPEDHDWQQLTEQLEAMAAAVPGKYTELVCQAICLALENDTQQKGVK